MFHEHPYQPDGILYPARHDSRRSAVAIFERSPSISVVQQDGWYDGGSLRPLLAEILKFYDFGLAETIIAPERKAPGRETEDPQGSLFEH